jgi:hypothetical protein
MGVTAKRLVYGPKDEQVAEMDLSFTSDSNLVHIALLFKSFESI